jgi:NADH dehydrogenase FAD-containing subunit
LQEIKQGYLAAQHAAVIIQNIKKLVKNPSDENLAVYKVSASAIGIVSLGRVNGVAQMPFGTIIGRMAGMLKSKDLFISKSRTDLGLKAK